LTEEKKSLACTNFFVDIVQHSKGDEMGQNRERKAKKHTHNQRKRKNFSEIK